MRTTWPNRFAFALDPQGRGSVADTNNFTLATDEGDGALFTRMTDATARLPAFGEMKFASGATLDLNGNADAAAVELVQPDNVACRGVKKFTILRAPSITMHDNHGKLPVTCEDRNWVLTMGGTSGAQTLELQYCAGTVFVFR